MGAFLSFRHGAHAVLVELTAEVIHRLSKPDFRRLEIPGEGILIGTRFEDEIEGEDDRCEGEIEFHELGSIPIGAAHARSGVFVIEEESVIVWTHTVDDETIPSPEFDAAEAASCATGTSVTEACARREIAVRDLTFTFDRNMVDIHKGSESLVCPESCFYDRCMDGVSITLEAILDLLADLSEESLRERLEAILAKIDEANGS